MTNLELESTPTYTLDELEQKNWVEETWTGYEDYNRGVLAYQEDRRYRVELHHEATYFVVYDKFHDGNVMLDGKFTTEEDLRSRVLTLFGMELTTQWKVGHWWEEDWSQTKVMPFLYMNPDTIPPFYVPSLHHIPDDELEEFTSTNKRWHL